MRENDLLAYIASHNASLPPSVTLPPGDDMGAIQLHGSPLLITTDQLADTVHFDARLHTPHRFGRKAITRNLSDVAAMAAVPLAAVAAAALPRSMSPDDARALVDALRTTASHYHCPLIGGDLALWDHPLLITVTLLATPGPHGILTRSGARVGDLLAVTGPLGDTQREQPDGRIHHLDFEPRLREAQLIAPFATSMMDLSDGLAADLPRLCAASGVGAELDPDAIPMRTTLHAALNDGEDYELLFTCRQPPPLGHVIGRIVPPEQRITLTGLGPLPRGGWEHRGGSGIDNR